MSSADYAPPDTSQPSGPATPPPRSSPGRPAGQGSAGGGQPPVGSPPAVQGSSAWPPVGTPVVDAQRSDSDRGKKAVTWGLLGVASVTAVALLVATRGCSGPSATPAAGTKATNSNTTTGSPFAPPTTALPSSPTSTPSSLTTSPSSSPYSGRVTVYGAPAPAPAPVTVTQTVSAPAPATTAPPARAAAPVAPAPTQAAAPQAPAKQQPATPLTQAQAICATALPPSLHTSAIRARVKPATNATIAYQCELSGETWFVGAPIKPANAVYADCGAGIPAGSLIAPNRSANNGWLASQSIKGSPLTCAVTLR